MASKRTTCAVGMAMGAALSLITPPSLANLLEYEFQSVDGKIKTLLPDSSHANPSSSMQFTLSAGLDRKVRISILDAQNAVVSTETSGLLGVTNRIEVNGKDYYGDTLQLPAPADGAYQLKAEILNSTNESIQSNTHPLIIDTQAPSVGEFAWGMSYGGGTAPDGLPIFSTVNDRHITLNNVTDPVSGIGQIQYRTYWESGTKAGEVYTSNSVPYYPVDQKAMLGTGGIDSGSADAFPGNVQSKHRITFAVSDKAGNTATVEQSFYNNSACGPIPETVAIESPSYSGAYMDIPAFQGFKPVNGEALIEVNPLRLVVKTPKWNYRGLEEGAIFGGIVSGRGTSVAHQDADHVYLIIEGPVGDDGTMDWPQTGWTNYSTWRCGAISVPNPTFTPEARAPRPTMLEAYVDGIGWVSNIYSANRSAPKAPRDTRISKFRYTVEPRPYEQEATLYSTSCLVAPGETSCLGDIDLGFNQTGTASHYHYRPVVRKTQDHSLYNRYNTFVWEWDAADPSITGLVSADTDNRKIVFDAVKTLSGRTWNRVRMQKGGLVFVASDGTRQEVGGNLDTSGNDSRVTTSYDALPEGNFEIYGFVEDYNRNRAEKHFLSIYNDRTKPTAEIRMPSQELQSLDDILVVIADDKDVEPTLKSIQLKDGPASENIQLSWRKERMGEYKLEYPLMFPSTEPGEEYTLVVTVEDSQGNIGIYDKTFSFTPRTTIINGEQGVLMPAIKQSIVGGGLPPIYSDPITLGDGTLVVGQYDLVATLRSDSDFGINMMGYELQPGDTIIIDNYDFSANGNKVALPAYPTDLVVGQANLLIFPGAPGAEFVLAQINTWKPNPVVTVNGQPFADGLTIEQAIEPVEISVTGGAGDPCTYTADAEEAVAANPLLNPMCTIEWNLPDTVKWDPSEYLAKGYLTGVEEDAHIGYRVFIPQGTTAKGVEVGSNGTTIDVVHPDLKFEFDPATPVTRYITEFTKTVTNTGSAECAPTVNPSDARIGTRYGYSKCLIEWNLVPEGIATSNYTPIVQGVAQNKDQIEFTFDVTYYDTDENAYFMPEQALSVEVEPPKPVRIELPDSEYEPDLGGAPRYFVGLDGDYLGTAKLTASGADIDMDISKGGSLAQSLAYLHRGGRDRDADYEFRIWMDDLKLWEESAVEVKGAYRLMPEISDAVQATVIGVPSTQMRAKLEVDGRKLLDTDEIAVAVLMEGRALSNGYHPHEHGVWKAQVRYEEKDGTVEDLTSWQFVDDNGSVAANITLGDRSDGYMYAVLRLDSPYEEYTREMMSNRNYVNVLRGGEIDGDITATSVSGRSVFTAFLRVEVDDQSYDNSLGDVEWLMSTDGGSTWEPVEDGARGNYMRADFNAGRYQVKARLRNKYTEAVSETGIQEIHVYDVPRVDIEGAGYAFTTQEVELRATATLDWEPVPIEKYHVEWSSDDGETWEPGLTTKASYDGENDRVRYRVRVRDMDAPMEEEGIWRERSHRLNFMEPEGPRTRIYGPRRLERGDPGDYEVEMNPPRRNMDVEMAGEWQLPDGTIIPGDDMITYNPSEDDVENGRVELIYRSWVKGYRDQGAIDERVHRISAWQYVWPQWDVFANTRAMEAPAEIRLTPRTPGWFGWLDEERYDWTFPAGTELVYDNEERPTIRINDPGEHEIVLRVSDARGNETEVVKALKLDEPSATEIDFSFYTDNAYMRAPLEIRPRIYMRGGHRLDRVQEREILINGQSLVRDSQIRSFVIEKPGFYEVTAKLYSQMGREESVTETIEVVPNKPPVCAPVADDRFGYLIIEANCSDEDGDIEEIRWEMAGEVLPSSSYKYRFTEGQMAEMGGRIQVDVSAMDDAGVYSAKETVNYTAP